MWLASLDMAVPLSRSLVSDTSYTYSNRLCATKLDGALSDRCRFPSVVTDVYGVGSVHRSFSQPRTFLPVHLSGALFLCHWSPRAFPYLPQINELMVMMKSLHHFQHLALPRISQCLVHEYGCRSRGVGVCMIIRMLITVSERCVWYIRFHRVLRKLSIPVTV
jgi:hypothetical protein